MWPYARRLDACLIALLFLAIAPRAWAEVRYVDDSATGTSDGSTWCDAFLELQSALAVATAGDEIRVAAGTYTPDYDPATGQHTGDIDASFQLITGVALRGGYAGCGQADPDARDITLHETILSGDLEQDDPPFVVLQPDTSRVVVCGTDTDATAVLDGFTLAAGKTGMRNDRASSTVAHCL